MSRHKVDITPNGVGGSIKIDDNEISDAVTGAALYLRVGDIPRLDLELHIIDVTPIDAADVELMIPARTREALITLGWTPPPGD
jgi:hypothetical protein